MLRKYFFGMLFVASCFANKKYVYKADAQSFRAAYDIKFNVKEIHDPKKLYRELYKNNQKLCELDEETTEKILVPQGEIVFSQKEFDQIRALFADVRFLFEKKEKNVLTTSLSVPKKNKPNSAFLKRKRIENEDDKETTLAQKNGKRNPIKRSENPQQRRQEKKPIELSRKTGFDQFKNFKTKNVINRTIDKLKTTCVKFVRSLFATK